MEILGRSKARESLASIGCPPDLVSCTFSCVGKAWNFKTCVECWKHFVGDCVKRRGLVMEKIVELLKEINFYSFILYLCVWYFTQTCVHCIIAHFTQICVHCIIAHFTQTCTLHHSPLHTNMCTLHHSPLDTNMCTLHYSPLHTNMFTLHHSPFIYTLIVLAVWECSHFTNNWLMVTSS